MPLFLTRPLISGQNLRHYLKLIGINVILFFILGPSMLLRYAGRVLHYAETPQIWRGNHSMASFSEIINTYYFPMPCLYALLLTGVLIMILWILILTYRRTWTFCNKHLVFLLVTGSLLIPSVSHDYKLPAISLALLYYLLNSAQELSWRQGLVYFTLILAVFLMHVSHVYYVGPFQFLRTSKLPLLFAAAIMVTLMASIAPPLNRFDTASRQGDEEKRLHAVKI